MLKEIPVIGLDQAHSATSFVDVLGNAFRDIGFVFVRVPALTEKLPRIYDEFQRVFDLSEEAKAKYAHPEIFYQRGWTPPFHELGIACRRIGPGKTPMPDAKENWFIGPDLPSDHYLVTQFPALYPQNIWPAEVSTFKPAMLELYNDLYNLGRHVLRATGEYLGKPQGFFDEVIRESPTVMRAIHYPRVKEEQIGKIVWACQHTDINLVTVLPASTRSGLWIRRRDGEWIPGNAPEGCVVVQVADMLDYLTGGHLISAAHEVRAPEISTEKGRLSAALFIHARSDVLLEPDATGSDASAYQPITAGELLLQRLKAIGLA